MSEWKPSGQPEEGTGQQAERGQSAMGEPDELGQSEEFGQTEGNDVPEEGGGDVTPAAGEDSTAAEEASSEREARREDSRTLGQVLEATTRISEQVAALADIFQKKILYSANEEKITDRMHEELQKYKQDMYSQLVRPILLDIIEVRDRILNMGEVYKAKPEGEQDIPNEMFSGYAYHDLQEILEKNNIEIHRSQIGDDFVPVKQRAVKKTSTSDISLHGKIAESRSCGYSCNGRTISAEKVSVYCYEKPSEKEEEREEIHNG